MIRFFLSSYVLFLSAVKCCSCTWCSMISLENVLEERKKRCLRILGEITADRKSKVMYLYSIMPWDIFANYLEEEVNHLSCCIKGLRHAANRLIPRHPCLVWFRIWVSEEGAVQTELWLSSLSWHIVHIVCKTWLQTIRSSNKLLVCFPSTHPSFLSAGTIPAMFRGPNFPTCCPPPPVHCQSHRARLPFLVGVYVRIRV